jgi:hypothetical protein
MQRRNTALQAAVQRDVELLSARPRSFGSKKVRANGLQRSEEVTITMPLILKNERSRLAFR